MDSFGSGRTSSIRTTQLEPGQVLAARKLLISHRRFVCLGQQRNKPTRLLDVVHRAEKIVERVVRIVARALDDGVRKEPADVSVHVGHGGTARRVMTGGREPSPALVPLAGLEPAQCCHYLILSQIRSTITYWYYYII